MKDAKQFVDRLKLERQADALLKGGNIDHLLGNKSNKHASGKFLEYKKLLAVCKFKMAVYWKVDKWGREYTMPEIKANKHRRYIPSNDMVRRVVNEEIGLNTLINKCLQEYNRMFSAQIFYVDRIGGFEYMVFQFDANNFAASKFTEIEFKTNEYGNTHFSKMLDEPLRVDPIINYGNE